MGFNTVWIPAFFTIWCLPIQNVSLQRFFESFCYVTMWFLGCFGLFYRPAGVIVRLIHAPLLNTTIIHVFTCWSLGVFTNTYFSSEDLSFVKIVLYESCYKRWRCHKPWSYEWIFHKLTSLKQERHSMKPRRHKTWRGKQNEREGGVFLEVWPWPRLISELQRTH